MFIDPICKINLRQAHRLSGVVGTSAVILLMLAASSLFGGTAEELELAKDRDAQAASESLSFINVAEELDLAPAPIPSADCPPRSTGRSRPTTPTRVSPMTTYRPPLVYAPRKQPISYSTPQVRYAPKPQVIYYTPRVRSTPASAKAQPTSLPVGVIYKDITPRDLTPDEKEIVRKAQQEIQEINNQLGLNQHAIGRKEAVLATTGWNREQVKLDYAQKVTKLQELHQTIMNSGMATKTSHPLYSDYLTALKKCNDLENEIERLGSAGEQLDSELQSLREERERLKRRRDVNVFQIETTEAVLPQKSRRTQGK